MHASRRLGHFAAAPLLLALAALAGGAAPARAEDAFAPFAAEPVIEIATRDEDGAARDTSVWIVVLDGAGFVRTNDSRWLANIRRGSPVAIRAAGAERAVRTSEVDDAALKARVEEAFLAKYGTMQRVMSALRWREPTVLRLAPAAPLRLRRLTRRGAPPPARGVARRDASRRRARA